MMARGSQGRRGHQAQLIFALLACCLFALCLLMVLLLGARAYQRVAAAGTGAGDQLDCLAYISAKVRNHDGLGQVFLDGFSPEQPLETLYLRQELDGVVYDTRIYYWQGWVRELYSQAGLAFSPEDGATLLEASGLGFSLEDGVLTVNCPDEEGRPLCQKLKLRSGWASP